MLFFHRFQTSKLFPQVFNCVKDRRLTRPWQDLDILPLTPGPVWLHARAYCSVTRLNDDPA